MEKWMSIIVMELLCMCFMLFLFYSTICVIRIILVCISISYSYVILHHHLLSKITNESELPPKNPRIVQIRLHKMEKLKIKTPSFSPTQVQPNFIMNARKEVQVFNKIVFYVPYAPSTNERTNDSQAFNFQFKAAIWYLWLTLASVICFFIQVVVVQWINQKKRGKTYVPNMYWWNTHGPAVHFASLERNVMSAKSKITTTNIIFSIWWSASGKPFSRISSSRHYSIKRQLATHCSNSLVKVCSKSMYRWTFCTQFYLVYRH